jgi:hypothetical protein
VNKHQKTNGGWDHESKISSANCTRSNYRLDASAVASRGGVLDDVPSWINGDSKRGGDAGRNRDSGTSRRI